MFDSLLNSGSQILLGDPDAPCAPRCRNRHPLLGSDAQSGEPLEGEIRVWIVAA
uniref:Uncharacterized protein n=1 Tax=Anguilla anguilla TaxID=7936 RepID=A0A0E9U9X8_ANGAN